MAACAQAAPGSRRRAFWATQPNACGVDGNKCGDPCGIAGLQIIDNDDGRTFATNDWLRGLVLNILMTDAKLPNTSCGYVPGTQGGHWSESFRGDGQVSGTLVRDLPTSSSIAASVAMAKARLTADMAKLIALGVATSVEVVTTYLGGQRISAEIVVVGQSGEKQRVGLSGSRLENSWVWT